MQVTRFGRAAVAFAAVLATGAAAQQPSSKDLYKGKVKEGLYEVKSDADLSGVPGIPKEQWKSSETRQRCLTKQDVERGIEAGKDCEIKGYKPGETSANVVMSCKDGTTTEMRYAFSPTGFASEMKTTGTQDGKSFVSVFRSQARFMGPCPAVQGPAPAIPKK